MPRPNVRVKSVHFNITKKEDEALLKHIGRKNFSRYVKQLIKADMEKGLPKQSIKMSGGITFKLE